MIKLITVCHDRLQATTLINSATKNGWDLEVIETPWYGFGTKIIETYKYLTEHPEIDAFVFCDAFDVVVLGTLTEFKQKLVDNFNVLFPVVGAEKGCWPVPDLADFYPNKQHHGFNYVNSGCYYCPSQTFIYLVEAMGCQYHDDDQLWWTNIFLDSPNVGVQLDREQILFNNHSFIDASEYAYDNGRIQVLGNEPVFIHSNGRSVDNKLDELICSI